MVDPQRQQMITLDLPWPPTANRYWRNVQGRMVLSREGRSYREVVDGLWWKLRCEKQPSETLDGGDIWVSIEAYPPDNRRRDLDNILKPLFDAIQYAGAFADDSQIVKLAAVKREPVQGGMVRVSLGRCVCDIEAPKKRPGKASIMVVSDSVRVMPHNGVNRNEAGYD